MDVCVRLYVKNGMWMLNDANDDGLCFVFPV